MSFLFHTRLACIAAGTVLFFSPLLSSAQDANRDVVFSRTDAAALVDHLAKVTGDFKDEFNHAVEHSMMDGTRLEDNAKHQADRFHDSAKKLRDVFHDKKDKNNPAVREQVDKTMSTGSELNLIMVRHRFTEKLQHDWSLIRADLNSLAAIYQLTPLEPGSNR